MAAVRRAWLPALSILATLGVSTPALTAEASTTSGYDISWPQCPSHFPRGGGFGIVGVNDGIAWSQNPCLYGEYIWAAGRPAPPALYMNTADPGPQSSHWALGGPKASACNPADGNPNSAAFAACAYDYGWNTAADSLTAEAQPVPRAATLTWWLDVETSNTWNGSSRANAQDVQGSIDYLRVQGVNTVGVYSTAYQWGVITGGYAFTALTPEWVAGARSAQQARSACSSPPFAGRNSPIRLAQYPSGGFDADLVC